MIASLFKRPPIDAFAKSLADDINKRYPSALDADASKRPSVNRMTRIVEDACARAVEFQSQHRLGWMAKAKLANAFRWELTELGYRKDFVDLATEAVVVYLSKGRKV